MKGSIIMLIVMGAALLVWLVGTAVFFAARQKKETLKIGYVFHACCEKCEQVYDVDQATFLKPVAEKKVVVSRPQMMNGVPVTASRYRELSRRYQCPACGKKAFARILNYDEYFELTRPIALRFVGRMMAIWLAGGIIIGGVLGGISSAMSRKERQEAIEKILNGRQG